MFTLDQIDDIHDRLGKATSLPAYLKALKAIGVQTSDSYITDGHTVHRGADGSKALAEAGVEKWTFDTTALTITYYDLAGNDLLTEDLE